MRKLLLAVLTALFVASCTSFQWVVDDRTPEDALATQVVLTALVPLVTIEPEVVPPTPTEVLVPTVTSTPECLIKGNLSSSGEKIFHVPGQVSYERTVIDPERGEAFFCSEGIAVQEGFRKALR